MFVRVAAGRVQDVSPRVAENVHRATMFSAPESLGLWTNATVAAPPMPIGLVRSPDQFGGFFKVPDDSMYVVRGLVHDAIRWVLPSGETLTLTADESEYDIGLWQIPFQTKVYVVNCYVRLNQHTRRGLEQFGLIPPGTPIPNDEPIDTSTGFASALSNLVIIALVGAAIWFLPKGILK